VEVRDATITSVGAVGRRADPDVVDVDLTGLVLTPGFIDIHTHYDAQVLWDGGLSPSPCHGVTTVVVGNCGFGIAPTRAQHRSLMLGILEMVEDMSPDALAAGVRWDFESFPDYLDVVEGIAKRINVAAFVGHTPVRVHVLGDEAFDRAATPAEREEMGALVAGARRAGAWGFATSLAANHAGPGGRHVPSFVGAIDEAAELVAAMGGGVVEVARGTTPLEEVAKLASPGVTVSWSSLLTGRPGEPRSVLELVEETAALGLGIWPQMSCRPLTIQLSLANPISLAAISCMKQILATPPDQRRDRYLDAAWRRRALDEVGESWRPMWERAVALLDGVEDPADGVAVGARAASLGVHPLDALIDLALEHGLDTRFSIPVANLDETQLAVLLRDRRTILGLSDAGAHANQQCDASFATYLLGHWVREKGVLSLSEAVWRLTGQPAQVYGFSGRGVVRPGAVADLVAFDPATVAAEPLERVRDFPAGTTRLISRSRGVEHVWVAGSAIVSAGDDQPGTPGRLLRAVR
jgi:N-acyl-D-aspartate/D-glutamate deacylase